MNEKKRLIKNTGIIAIGNISTKIVTFLLLPLYTAKLSTNQFGMVDYIASISVFVVPFVTLLIDESMFRFLIDCESELEKRKVISNSVFIFGIGNLLFIIIFFPVLLLIHYKYTLYLALYIVSAALVQMLCSLFRGLGKITTYATFSFAVSTTAIILNVFFIAFLHLKIRGMLSAFIISHILISFIYFFVYRLFSFFSFDLIDRHTIKTMIKYSVPLIPNKISWSIINLSDRILIMNFIDSNAAGIYAISYKFPNLLDTVYGFFYQSWKESSARALKMGDANDFYNKVYVYLKKLLFSVALVLIAIMPLVFKILINESYNDALKYVPILVLGTYFANISGFYGGIFTAYKNTKIMGTTTILAAVINIVVNIIFIWSFGLYAAAISTLVANYVVYVYRKYSVNKYVSLTNNTFHSIISFIVCFAVLICFYLNDAKLWTVGGIISVIYAIVNNRIIVKKTKCVIQKRIAK